MATKIEQWKTKDGMIFEYELPALIHELVLARNNSPKDDLGPDKLSFDMTQALLGISAYIKRHLSPRPGGGDG